MANIPTRNNNPGDIKDTKTGKFKTYSSPLAGYGALVNDLSAKQTGNTTTGLNGDSSLVAFANKYAPSSDSNDPISYANSIAKNIGVTPDTPIGKINVHKLAAAVAKQEGYEGDIPQPLSVNDFATKIKEKYPVYKDLDNNELVEKITAKYPEYKGVIDYSQQSVVPTGGNAGKFNVPGEKISIAQAQEQANKLKQDSDNTGSITGILGNTAKGVFNTLTSSEQGLGNTVGGIINANNYSGEYADIAENNSGTQVKLLNLIKEKQAKGEDTTNLEKAYNSVQNVVDSTNKNLGQSVAGADKSTGQVLGEIGGSALDLLSSGAYGKSAAGLKSGELAAKATDLVPSTVKGVGKLASKPAPLFTKPGLAKVAEGAGLGYAQDVTQGLQGNRGDDRTGTGALIPGLGTAIGGGLPTLVGSLKGTQKAISPSFEEKVNQAFPVLKKDVTNLPQKYKNIYNAASDIVENKNSLGLTDKNGESRLPKNFSETVDAQKQRLNDIYKGYTDKLSGIDSTEFRKNINGSIKGQITAIDEQLSKENSVDGRRALAKIKTELRSLRDTSPTGIQNYIESINQRIKPSAPGGSLNTEQIKLANLGGEMRKALDNSVEKVNGAGYQELRNKYAAHKAMQSQLLMAAKKEINNSPGLTEKLSNLGVSAEGLNFIITHDPHSLAVAAGLKGFAKLVHWFNSPTRALEGIFSDIEKGYKRPAPLSPEYINQTASKNPIASNMSKKFLPLTPPNLRNRGSLAKEIAQRNIQATLATKPKKL